VVAVETGSAGSSYSGGGPFGGFGPPPQPCSARAVTARARTRRTTGLVPRIRETYK
jgi:hypothetical protein